jgi:hypothetical protein
MKKIILSICFLSGLLSIAQNEEAPAINEDSKANTETPKELNVLYANFASSVGANLGLIYEYSKNNREEARSKKSYIFKIHYISSTLEFNNSPIKDINGHGVGVEFGHKTYYNKSEHKGFYSASYITAGTVKFDEKNIYTNGTSGANTDFDGSYNYLSLFSPEFGYKLLLGNKIAVDFHFGTSWLIEFKSKGDVDNRAFDNWTLNGGISIGYNF